MIDDDDDDDDDDGHFGSRWTLGSSSVRVRLRGEGARLFSGPNHLSLVGGMEGTQQLGRPPGICVEVHGLLLQHLVSAHLCLVQLAWMIWQASPPSVPTQTYGAHIYLFNSIFGSEASYSQDAKDGAATGPWQSSGLTPEASTSGPQGVQGTAVPPKPCEADPTQAAADAWTRLRKHVRPARGYRFRRECVWEGSGRYAALSSEAEYDEEELSVGLDGAA